MNRIVAALLLMLWAASTGRCLAEQYGLLHETPGLECCDHGHEDEPEPIGHSHSNPCGICHMIEHSGVSLAKPVALAALCILPVAELPLPELDLMPVAMPAGWGDALTRPPILPDWGAYLIRTCLPVRGPNLA